MSIYKNGKLIAGGRQCMPLLSFMWADHILDEVSWLRADTFSWQPGSVYIAVYQHLAADITDKTLQSETIGGTTIQFYLADDGHKICPASEESNVSAIYNATGAGWYYIIDTTNQRFKLPRINPDLEELAYQISAFGDGDYLRFMSSSDSNKGSYIKSSSESLGSGTGWLRTYNSGGGLVNLGNMKLSDVKGQSGIKVEKDTIFSGKKYLYFYVGNFTQTALENTAGLNAELFDGKADVSTVAHVVTEFQEPTSANNYTWYRKYADGWVEQGQDRVSASGTITVSFPVAMASSNYTIVKTMQTNSTNAGISYNQVSFYNKTTTGATTSTAGVGFSWQVSGMAA